MTSTKSHGSSPVAEPRLEAGPEFFSFNISFSFFHLKFDQGNRINIPITNQQEKVYITGNLFFKLKWTLETLWCDFLPEKKLLCIPGNWVLGTLTLILFPRAEQYVPVPSCVGIDICFLLFFLQELQNSSYEPIIWLKCQICLSFISFLCSSEV